MNKLVLYELIQAANRAFKDKSSKVLQKLNVQVIDIIGLKASKSSNELSLTDIPTSISRKQIIDCIDLLEDHIISIKYGYGSSKILAYEYYKAQKLLFVAEISNTLLLRHAALFVAEHVVKKSKKFFFLNITFLAYRIVYSTSMFMNDEKKVIEASLMFHKYLEYYRIEKSIEIEFNSLIRAYRKSSTYSEITINRCNRIINQFSQFEDAIPSFYFHHYLYYVRYLKYLHERNHSEMIKNAVKALSWFEAQSFDYIPGKLLHTTIQIVYYIQTRDFDKAFNFLTLAKTFITNKSQHWLRLNEHEIMLNFHKGDFNKAIKIFFETSSSKLYSHISPADQNRWSLLEAYVNLSLETNSVDFNKRRKRFSIQKFINDQPRFSKDKRSMNIPILIAQMLFFIVRRQYNHAIDRIEALEKYSSRYLRNDETFRSNCFIKMILEIPKNSFNQLRVERAAQKYFNRLLDSEIELINQPFEIEIIPYERLWAMIMDHLRADHHYTPKKIRAA